jgi:hypothetical protein
MLSKPSRDEERRVYLGERVNVREWTGISAAQYYTYAESDHGVELISR